jgi:quercetin dioxygenase-like cupin family protein
MHRSAIAIGLLVAGSLAATAAGTNNALAGQERQEYKSPGSVKEMLLQEPLHGLKNEQITIMHVAFPPGWVGGQHYHTGPVYVYVLKGSFAVHEKGKDVQVIPAGHVYREPIGNPMEARNQSSSKPTEVLLVQVGHKDEPLMVKTSF